jgi:micrococcal nuclease
MFRQFQKYPGYFITLILAIAVLSFSAVSAKAKNEAVKEQTSKSGVNAPKTAIVSKVLDGDTFVLSDGKHVRILGIDTPEKGEPFAENAGAFCDSMLRGKTVKLEYEPETEDKYGRLLAYVFVNSDFVNELLLKRGLARVYIFNRKERYNSRFISDQKEARNAKAGVWSLPTPSPEPYYVVPGSSFRFHRPLCPLIKKINVNKAKKVKSRDEALDLGLSPCRECRP